jgi:MEMO1 family protein
MNKFAKLAKDSVIGYIRDAKIANENDYMDDDFQGRSGVFVSIYNGNKLRGCVGTILPTKDNLAKEIIINSIEAATNDYRFKEVTEPELDDLIFEVNLLGKPKKIKTKEELDVAKYGVIVCAKDGRTGLLLPDLDGVDSVDFQLEIACNKASIDPKNDDYEIYKFKVERYR